MRAGRYEILEIIGEGASGRVARAQDPLMGRVVAVKLLSEEFARPAAREHFLKEASIAGQLTHPGIVALHDIGIEESSSTPYLVMEYIEGLPLDRLLRKGSVAHPKACAWIAHAASALAAAHRKGIVHGDVKPANILITSEGSVKLTDFGMARFARRGSSDDPLLGAPAYWSPEQIVGRPLNARSDIFSLGVVLYELVTGRRPFAGETQQAICGQILSTPHVPPSQVKPALPATLDTVLQHCLAKNPAERYANGEALAVELYPFARRKPQAQPAATAPTAEPRGPVLVS